MSDYDKERVRALAEEIVVLNRKFDTYNENLVFAFNLMSGVLTHLHNKKDSEIRRYADLDRENTRLISENTRLKNVLTANGIDPETGASKVTR